MPPPRQAPQRGVLTEDEFERRWAEKEAERNKEEQRKAEIAEKDEMIEALKRRLDTLETGEGPRHTRNRDEDDRISQLEKELDRVKSSKEIDSMRQQMAGRMAVMETEIQHAKETPTMLMDNLRREGAIGHQNSLSDGAQVQMKEIDAKLTTLTTGVTQVTDLAKTYLTLNTPMRGRTGSAMTDDERERARRELGG
jgi:predicted RNase H-like nuclease (RuvC/YqgF family)